MSRSFMNEVRAPLFDLKVRIFGLDLGAGASTLQSADDDSVADFQAVLAGLVVGARDAYPLVGANDLDGFDQLQFTLLRSERHRTSFNDLLVVDHQDELFALVRADNGL